MRNGSESFPCGEYLYWNDAEKGLLSSMMQDPNRAIPLGLRRVSATHFFVPAHQTIFTELCTAYRQRGTFDLIVFTEHLRQVGQIDQVGGPAFVTELFTFAPTAANIEYYIDIVQDKYPRRQMIEAATATIRMAQEEQEDIRALLQVAQQNLERFRLLASGRFDDVEDFPFADLLAFDPKADADNLLGHRWLCRGSTCLWAGAAGVGKSSVEMQLAIYWGCGLPCFRVTPVRPLKSLIIQAENDLGDTGEQLQGVIEGISKADDIELADVERRDQVQRNVVIVRVIGTTGKKFCALLESLLDLHKPDLVWIDPLFAFAGCDLRDAKEVGLFLREGLIPIAVRHRVCVHVIHHVGKPDRDSKAKSSWTDLDFQYLGFGSSEIQNAFRAVNVILPVSGEEKVFRLIFSKRGKRAGAKSPDGEFTTNIYLTHAKEGIYWLQVDEPVQPQKARGNDSQFQAQFSTDQIADEMSATQSWSAADLQRRMKHETGMAEKTFYRLWAKLKTDGRIRVDQDRKWVIKPQKEVD